MISHDGFADRRRCGQAGMAGGPEAAVRPFAGDAADHESPFDPPMIGRDAIRRDWAEGAKEVLREVGFAAQPVAVDGRCRGCRQRWHRREAERR